MTMMRAKQLHYGDHVQIKATGEICRVISTAAQVDPDGDQGIQVYCCTAHDGYVGLHHAEVLPLDSQA
jgi:hypothetical protein